MWNEVIDEISNKVPEADSVYLGEDGLKYCSVCHKRVQRMVTFMGITKKVNCRCDCFAKEQEAIKERERREEADRKRKVCFAKTNMAAWTFENDDRQHPRISDAMQNYASQFKDFKRDGKGLILHGPTGTGKTYLAACVANRLIDDGYKCYMTNFSEVINRMQEKFDGRQEFIEGLNDYSLLIIDDLGIERGTEYVLEIVFNIIDSRYRAGLPFIITTNRTMEQLKNPESVEYARIYERILERCFPIKVDGVSRRRQSVKDSYYDIKEKLGL